MSSARDERRSLLEQLIGNEVAEGRFKVTHLLGFGGMGAVYGAVQKNMDRSVALKLIPTHDPTTVARFEREALTISKLRHPNTITVFDYGQTEDNFLFLSMEMLEGKTLTEVIAEGPRSAVDTVHIASQICRSLSEAHRNGIVHRDVKPDNIMIIAVDDDPNVVKVLDFGIAKAVFGEDDVQLTGDGRIVGTPRYMSPEQILADPVDLRCDIYALGCIMFEMLCGAPPFQQKSTTALMISHTQDPPPAFAQRLDTGVLQRMPGGIERVVRKALAKNPNNRQQSCDELRLELEHALAGMQGQEEFNISASFGVDASNQHSASRSGHFPNPNQAAQSSASGEIPGFTSSQQALVPAAAPTEKSDNKMLPLIILGGLLLTGIAVFVILSRDNSKDQQVVEAKEIVKKVAVAKPIKDTVEYVRFEIRTKPVGASISENGAYLGKTPFKFPVKKTKEKVSLTLSKEGYKPLPIVLFVDPQKQESIKIFDLEQSAKKPKIRNKIRRVAKPPKVEEKKVENVEKKPTKIQMLKEDKGTKVKVLD